MTFLGRILGIVGGPAGLFVFVLYLIQGLGPGVPETTGTMDAVVGYLGGLAALTCIAAGVAVLFAPGWMAGVVLFVAALVGVVLGGHFFLMSPALLGGMIVMANGRRRFEPGGPARAPRAGSPPALRRRRPVACGSKIPDRLIDLGCCRAHMFL